MNPMSSLLLQIVNWRTHLKFPEEAKLSPEAKDLICKLLCNVEQRLGTKGAHEIKVHLYIIFEILCTFHKVRVKVLRNCLLTLFSGSPMVQGY